MTEEAMHGVFLDRDTLDHGDIDFTSLAATLADWVFHDLTDEAEVAERIAQATVVVSSYATPAVAEHVFALILALTRRLPDYAAAVAAGRWQRSAQFALLDFPITELRDKTLGIIGYGELGRAVAKLGEAFGMQVLIAARLNDVPQPGRVPLHTLLPQVDILSLHVPLTAATTDLIGAAELALMKPSALLINTARGGSADDHALAEALRAGRLGGAGGDVLTAEPPRA